MWRSGIYSAISFKHWFILTAVDAGSRAARFMLGYPLGVGAASRTDSLPANLLATALCVLAWGYFLHQGVVDPLGGINTRGRCLVLPTSICWQRMALMLCAVVLFKIKRQRYAWVALVPTAWLLLIGTLTAGWQKAFSPDAKVGFPGHC
ncbi:carbon starvation CstA family protein [Escherichia coli]